MVSTFLSQNISPIGLLLLYLRVEKNISKIISKTMNVLLKNLGVIILLIGAGVLAFHFFSEGSKGSNLALITGVVAVLIGYVVHIFLNKRFG